MMDLIRDLYNYQEWADAESWKAIEATPAATQDEQITKTLNHLHQVQMGFLMICRGDPIDMNTARKPLPLDELKQLARRYHSEVKEYLGTLSEDRLKEPVSVPWFAELKANALEATTQALLHTQGHRAQNATRLRELGGASPITDYIVWCYKGRPSAEWG
jgi:uncharacterized damage-inducible protein DinB